MTLKPNFKVNSNVTYTVMKFPSGEIQVTLNNHNHKITDIEIKGSILSSDNIIELLQLVEVIRNAYYDCTIILYMPYCAFSRQDRRCNQGEAFSLKIFAQLINSCNFIKVITCDNHSDVSTGLLDNCVNMTITDIFTTANEINNTTLDLKQYNYLVSPDAGANKKIFELSKEFNIPMIRADKTRDTKTGNILETEVYATAKQLDGVTVLIVDDICQGGKTFEELAKKIKTVQPNCKIHLYATHGFFSHTSGIRYMQNAGISKFITTTSVYKSLGQTYDQFITVLELY